MAAAMEDRALLVFAEAERRGRWLAQGERVDGAVTAEDAVGSSVLAEEDGAGGTVVVGTEEGEVGQETVPRLAHGYEATDGLYRKAEEDLLDDVLQQLCLTAFADTFGTHCCV